MLDVNREYNNYYRQETQMSHVFKSAGKHNNYYG